MFSIEQSVKEAQFNLNLENRIAKNDKYLLIQQQIKLNGLGIEKQSIDLNDNTFEIKLN